MNESIPSSLGEVAAAGARHFRWRDRGLRMPCCGSRTDAAALGYGRQGAVCTALPTAAAADAFPQD
eukprot:4530042-Prymnesium_polylepis.1